MCWRDKIQQQQNKNKKQKNIEREENRKSVAFKVWKQWFIPVILCTYFHVTLMTHQEADQLCASHQFHPVCFLLSPFLTSYTLTHMSQTPSTLIQGSPIRMKTSQYAVGIVSNKMTQLLTRHHLRPHLVRNLKCMLYTLFRLHIASGSEKIKSIHMCLKNMYWLGQQCDSSGYRYTVCRKYLQYLLLYLHLTLPHQWQKQNHISSALIPFERSQSLEVRPWRLEVWQLQNIFGSRGF